MKYWHFIFVFFLSGCLSGPAYVLMGINESKKRERYVEYATKGDVYSQYQLAESYCCGDKSFNDNAKAVEWYCKAASNGHSKAMYRLGQLYDTKNELSVSQINKDDAKAYFWYSLAEKRALFDGRQAREVVEKRLSKEQLQAGDVMLTDWKKQPCGN